MCWTEWSGTNSLIAKKKAVLRGVNGQFWCEKKNCKRIQIHEKNNYWLQYTLIQINKYIYAYNIYIFISNITYGRLILDRG